MLSKINHKRIFKISVIILTAVSFLITVKLNDRFSEREDLLEENFVKIIGSHYIENDICENLGIPDTGDICNQDYSEKIVISSSTASGVAFRRVDDITYVLTADHFCNPDLGIPDQLSQLMGIKSEISIEDVDGITRPAEQVYSSVDDDLCLLSTSLEIEKEIKVSDIFPEIGDRVTSISAPHGIHDRNVSLHFSGTFSGCNYSNICFYTLPAAPGSSGSLIFNSEGKIIGMIQMTSHNFSSLSIGVGLITIRDFLENAEAYLGVDLI